MKLKSVLLSLLLVCLVFVSTTATSAEEEEPLLNTIILDQANEFTVTLSQGAVLEIIYKDKEYNASIVNITENSVDLDSEYFSPLQFIKGNTKGMDLDKDGSIDVDLHLSDIKENQAEFVVKQNNNKLSSIIYNLWWMILLVITIIIIIYASSRRNKSR